MVPTVLLENLAVMADFILETTVLGGKNIDKFLAIAKDIRNDKPITQVQE
jgi:hypothetical protein